MIKSKIKIYDKDGDELSVTDIVVRFIYEQSLNNGEGLVTNLYDYTVGLDMNTKGQNFLRIYDTDIDLIDSIDVNLDSIIRGVAIEDLLD